MWSVVSEHFELILSWFPYRSDEDAGRLALFKLQILVSPGSLRSKVTIFAIQGTLPPPPGTGPEREGTQ